MFSREGPRRQVFLREVVAPPAILRWSKYHRVRSQRPRGPIHAGGIALAGMGASGKDLSRFPSECCSVWERYSRAALVGGGPGAEPHEGWRPERLAPFLPYRHS